MIAMLKFTVAMLVLVGCGGATDDVEPAAADASHVDAKPSPPLLGLDAGADVVDAAVDPDARVMTANCDGDARLGVCRSAFWDARVPFMASYGLETTCQSTPFKVDAGITTWREAAQAGCIDVGFPLTRCCPE